MYRYLVILSRTTTQALAFRSEIWIWFILDTIPIVILLLIWSSMYVTQSTINGTQFADVLLFYLLAFFMGIFTNAHFENWRIDEIRGGKIDYHLIKPLGYMRDISLRHLGDKLTSTTLKLPLLLSLTALLFLWSDSLTTQVSLTSASWFLYFLLWSFVTQLVLGILIVLCGFWLESAHGIDHFKWITISLFSGVLMPIALMPPWLQELTLALPLKYLYAVPIGVLQGQIVANWHDILYSTLFLTLLSILALVVWRKARRHYASSGG